MKLRKLKKNLFSAAPIPIRCHDLQNRPIVKRMMNLSQNLNSKNLRKGFTKNLISTRILFKKKSFLKKEERLIKLLHMLLVFNS